METGQTLVCLHGLGQSQGDWQGMREYGGADVRTPDLFALRHGAAEYGALREGLFAYCDALRTPLHLCGLSLGGVLALDYAAHRPERTASLVLIGTPYTMPKRLLRIQNAALALAPQRAFESIGLTKQQMRRLANSMVDLDIPALAKRVQARTLVLCGRRDWVNRRAARRMQQALADAALGFVENAGHEVNRDAPEALAKAMETFYRQEEGQ